MSQNPFLIIEECLLRISKEHIKIKSGATFDWVPSEFNIKPQAVNWAGAVLWVNEKNSYKSLLYLLNVDDFWYYSFTIGFDRRRIISICDKDFKEIRKDEVSANAYRLAKQYCC